MPSRSGLARDARPPGPIAIVQSYGTVWSTEQQDPKQDLRASDEEPSAVWSTRARNRTGNAELQSPRSENLTAKHSRLRRPCTAPPVIASYNNRRCHNKNKNVKTKMSQHFFPGSRPGCDRPFFRSYRRSEILSVSARSFATTSDTEALYFFLFLSGHEKELIGLARFHKQTPPKSFRTTSRGRGVPSVLDAR